MEEPMATPLQTYDQYGQSKSNAIRKLTLQCWQLVRVYLDRMSLAVGLLQEALWLRQLVLVGMQL
jgi:hypothetical protein